MRRLSREMTLVERFREGIPEIGSGRLCCFCWDEGKREKRPTSKAAEGSRC